LPYKIERREGKVEGVVGSLSAFREGSSLGRRKEIVPVFLEREEGERE